jgi:Putative Ig domain
MPISLSTGSVVAKAGQQISLSSLVTVTSGNNPTYLVVSLLDRNEYTASSNGNTGTLSGDGNTAHFANIGGDSNTIGVVFTYNASTGQYTNAVYGNLANLTYTASTNTNDNTSISIFATNNASIANQYANNPYALDQYAASSYIGSVSVVTQPSFVGPVPSQATPDSICSTALSFVGKAWNSDGCWVLASNISAEAGASLPITSTMLGTPGLASGEWIVAYNGPGGQSGNWQSQITAGEMVVFETSATSGHITTVVSGSGSSAMLVDNITYVNGSGGIVNSANDGSAADIVIAAPHLASQEWAQAVPGSVVVYELDCPIIDVKTQVSSVAAGGKEALATQFSATNPVASQAITQYQFYDTAGSDSFLVGSTDLSAHSAATAITVSAASLASTDLLAGATTGTDTIEVRAYNGSYWGDWQSLQVDVTPAAAPPTLTAQTPAQTWNQNRAVSLALAANTFTDPQHEALTYTATLANGQALPSWLKFNATTLTFTGTVPALTNGLSIKVTATDTSGLSASETFAVSTPASAPVLSAPTANQTWKQGQAVSFALAANTFTDPQQEALTYTATLANGQALPSWLKFNATTRTFSGTVPGLTSGLSIEVTATDASGLSASETFAVSTPASAPVVSAPTPTQTWKQGQAVNFTLAANTFTDPQQETLTYTATLANGQALPSWLRFNATTRSFTGTVPALSSGLSIKVTATDTSGLSASETFAVSTPASPPIISAQTPAQTWKQAQAVSFTLAANTFTDPQQEALAYTATLANGQALPSWLSFNAATRTFTGTVPALTSGLSIKVTATDTSGLSASETFAVSTPASAPSISSISAQTPSQIWKQGQAVSFTLAANTFTDPQHEALTYRATLSNGQALPSWLSFNATTLSFTGTVPALTSGLSIKVTATDTSGLSASETFAVSTPASAPVVSAPTSAQTWQQGQTVSFTLAANTFTDPQQEALTYTATQSNGQALPSWLKFTASTLTFSGTVPTSATALSLKVTATDKSGLSASETFAASITAAATHFTNAVSSLGSGSTAPVTALTSPPPTQSAHLATPVA